MESTNEKNIIRSIRDSAIVQVKVKASLRPKISRSKDAEDVLRKYWNEGTIELHEQFKILLLNRTNSTRAVCRG